VSERQRGSEVVVFFTLESLLILRIKRGGLCVTISAIINLKELSYNFETASWTLALDLGQYRASSTLKMLNKIFK